MKGNNTKVCIRCNIEKYLDSFRIGRNQCKACRRAIKAEYYRNNSELEKSRVAEYKRKNRKKVNAWNIGYQRRNPEKFRVGARRRDKKAIEQMSDRYIAHLIYQNSPLTREAIAPELIALKREQLKIKRYLKEMNP